MSNEDEFMALLSEYVAGELPTPDTERVAEHVSGCESCQRTVEGLRLLGPVLRAATAGADADAVDHTFALARAGARAARDNGVGTPSRRADESTRVRSWQRYLPAVAMAATVLLAFGLDRLISTDAAVESSGSAGRLMPKGAPATGTPSAMKLNLSFSVQAGDGTLARGRNGWKYPPEALLYFRCQLPRDGYILLVRVGEDGLESLTPAGAGHGAIPVSQGDWDLSDGTHLLGYSLEGLGGNQRFIALFSNAPFWLSQELQAALLSNRSDAFALSPLELLVDELSVSVAAK